MAKKKITVVIADDHPFLRAGVRVLLENSTGFSVVGEAKNGREAVSLTCELLPDVLLLDMQMPFLDGIQVMDALRKSAVSVRVIILTAFDDKCFAHEARTKGASGYYLKEDAPALLVDAIRDCVLRNKWGVSPGLGL